MGIHDWAAGEVASDTLLDEMSRQGRIICTSSTRPSSPVTGMSIYETDTTFTREWNGAAWRTLPKGILDRSTGIDTGPGGFIAGTQVGVNGSSCAFTSYDSTQEYKYTWRFDLSALAAGAIFDLQVQLDGSDIGVPHNANVITDGTGKGITCAGFIPFTAASNGAHTVAMRIIRTYGTGGGQIYAGGDFLLEHLGTQ